MTRAPMSYSPLVHELFDRLPGQGEVAPGSGVVVRGEAMALDRGAWVCLEARIEDGRIADCAFRAWGCPHTLAAAALLVSRSRGQPVSAGFALDAHRLAAELDAAPEKLGRLLVVEDAMRSLLNQALALESNTACPSR